jgi:dihydroorotate dehydrogenase electron transfer subunit
MPAPSAAGVPVLNAAEFATCGYPTVVTTDDGSLGMRGFVTQALRGFLAKTIAGSRTPHADRAGMVVFCCGPTAMMKATAALCAELGVRCQVSLEQPMACGMGTCQSCVVRWRPAGTADERWVYKLTCTDGPVFEACEIVW